jgi:hypothetical protein
MPTLSRMRERAAFAKRTRVRVSETTGLITSQALTLTFACAQVCPSPAGGGGVR